VAGSTNEWHVGTHHTYNVEGQRINVTNTLTPTYRVSFLINLYKTLPRIIRHPREVFLEVFLNASTQAHTKFGKSALAALSSLSPHDAHRTPDDKPPKLPFVSVYRGKDSVLLSPAWTPRIPRKKMSGSNPYSCFSGEGFEAHGSHSFADFNHCWCYIPRISRLSHAR
jgi:hypothetical protein